MHGCCSGSFGSYWNNAAHFCCSVLGFQVGFQVVFGSVVVLLCSFVHLGCVVQCWRLGSGGTRRGMREGCLGLSGRRVGGSSH